MHHLLWLMSQQSLWCVLESQTGSSFLNVPKGDVPKANHGHRRPRPIFWLWVSGPGNWDKPVEINSDPKQTATCCCRTFYFRKCFARSIASNVTMILWVRFNIDPIWLKRTKDEACGLLNEASANMRALFSLPEPSPHCCPLEWQRMSLQHSSPCQNGFQTFGNIFLIIILRSGLVLAKACDMWENQNQMVKGRQREALNWLCSSLSVQKENNPIKQSTSIYSFTF